MTVTDLRHPNTKQTRIAQEVRIFIFICYMKQNILQNMQALYSPHFSKHYKCKDINNADTVNQPYSNQLLYYANKS